MNHTLSDEHLDRLLVELDPAAKVTGELSRATLGDLVAQLAIPSNRAAVEAELARGSSARRNRRVAWTITGILALVIGLCGGVPAASAVVQWIAHTGTYGANFASSPKTATTDTETTDKSEWIVTSASDSGPVLAGLYPSSLTLPPGVTQSQLVAQIQNQTAAAATAAGVPTEMQSTGVQQEYEWAAACVWDRQWTLALAANDTRMAGVAPQQIAAIVRMPAIADHWGTDAFTVSHVKDQLAALDSGNPAQAKSFNYWNCRLASFGSLYAGLKG